MATAGRVPLFFTIKRIPDYAKQSTAIHPLSQEAATDRITDLSMLVHRVSRLVEDAKVCFGLACVVWGKYAAFRDASRAKAEAEVEAEDTAAMNGKA
jgi:hypothetical protein